MSHDAGHCHTWSRQAAGPWVDHGWLLRPPEGIDRDVWFAAGTLTWAVLRGEDAFRSRVQWGAGQGAVLISEYDWSSHPEVAWFWHELAAALQAEAVAPLASFGWTVSFHPSGLGHGRTLDFSAGVPAPVARAAATAGVDAAKLEWFRGSVESSPGRLVIDLADGTGPKALTGSLTAPSAEVAALAAHLTWCALQPPAAVAAGGAAYTTLGTPSAAEFAGNKPARDLFQSLAWRLPLTRSSQLPTWQAQRDTAAADAKDEARVGAGIATTALDEFMRLWDEQVGSDIPDAGAADRIAGAAGIPPEAINAYTARLHDALDGIDRRFSGQVVGFGIDPPEAVLEALRDAGLDGAGGRAPLPHHCRFELSAGRLVVVEGGVPPSEPVALIGSVAPPPSVDAAQVPASRSRPATAAGL